MLVLFLLTNCIVCDYRLMQMKLSSAIWPQTNIRIALAKSAVETIFYTPFAMTSFYFNTSLLELKTVSEASEEMREKFWPTYKVQYFLELFLYSNRFINTNP